MSHRINSIIACVAVITLAVSHSPATAQDQGTASLASLLNLEFKGGSAADFVETIRRSTAEVNLVVLADLTKVTMPAVTLQSVDPGTALNLLESLPRQQGNTMIAIKVRQDDVSLSGNNHQGQWPVFTIIAETAESRRSAPRDSLVLQVGDVLDEQMKAADMLTAIEAALSMLEPEFPAAQIKFHEATALLIARGHEEQIGCIQLVVQQLRERKTLMEQSLQSQVKKLQLIEAQAEQFSRQNEMLSRNIASMQRDLAAALDRCKVAEGDRDEYARHVKTLEQQLKEAKGG